MKKFTVIIIAINLLILPLLPYTARAYWVWTPQTKKFINPKYAVKDTPKEQYDWAMGFYSAKDYKRAAIEFEKLVKNYEYSEYAADAQYYAGRSYDNLGKYYIAFQNYQKTVDNFPHINNMEEIIAREFSIGNMYASKDNPKILGTDIMTSFDRAIEIYKKVVENAPFGELADQAQFKMALAMKEAGRYDEATLAFQKIVDDYPASKLYDQAKYEMANSAYKASLSPAYDAAPTDKALKAFEEFASTTTDPNLTKEATTTIKRLKNRAAEKSMMTAEFYEQRKKYASAIIYYQDVIDRYPDSISAQTAHKRIADLKSGNYSHRSPARVSAGKKSWIPWTGKGKQAEKKRPAPKASQTVATAPAVAEMPATPPESVPAPITVDEKQAADQDLQKAAIADTTGIVKEPSKKRWWAYGLSKDRGGKTVKPQVNKVKKPWTPLNFDKKAEGTKK